MNDDVIVPIFVVIDEVMRALDHQTHPQQAGASDSAVLTVATVAACQFHLPRWHPIRSVPCK